MLVHSSFYLAHSTRKTVYLPKVGAYNGAGDVVWRVGVIRACTAIRL